MKTLIEGIMMNIEEMIKKGLINAAIIEEMKKKDLINAAMRGCDATISLKEDNSEKLRQDEGTILEVEPGVRIIYRNIFGGETFMPFCDARQGIYLIVDKKTGCDLFTNNKVLQAYAIRGYDDANPIQHEQARIKLAKEGTFYIHPGGFPLEIRL